MHKPMSEERLAYLRTYVERASGMADFRLKSAVAEIERLRAKNEQWAECSMCGRQMSRNLHPDAGVPGKLSEAGAMWECIPCLVSKGSKAYWRAGAAEAEIERLRAENRWRGHEGHDIDWARSPGVALCLTCEAATG